MDTFDPEIFELKYRMADAATDLYMEGDGEFFIKDVARAVDLTPAEVFNYFPNKKSILEFYYASLVVRYEMMISEIDDFDSYTLKEKLSNFVFTNFDMLAEKESFVEDTFQEYIIRSYSKTEYEQEVERLTQQFLEHDPQISIASTLVLNSYAYSFLGRQYLELVRFWLNDTSEDKELSMELTDKLTAVLEEVIYNPVLDKSFDLLKFMNANRKEFFKNIPIVKQLCSKIEIK
ncbi:TetR/AcrR family transcriptional regulator [Fodinibius halophilus]|uniref:TetR/AcrR family transcriptional regulator n=1 Tax=Fodinibius halophilus TaxID=1736908 RepID=A0A6M1TDX7_9BACT|nr:TetR/AcrR family transcriptional regulator [Fodinibius halophilus]NGP88392.1 TetR/AcrR family transcriptional regulator [Fodinibius halophilus]